MLPLPVPLVLTADDLADHLARLDHGDAAGADDEQRDLVVAAVARTVVGHDHEALGEQGRELLGGPVREACGGAQAERQREAVHAERERRDRDEREEEDRKRAVESERTRGDVGVARVGDAGGAEAERGPEESRAQSPPPTASLGRGAPQGVHCAGRGSRYREAQSRGPVVLCP